MTLSKSDERYVEKALRYISGIEMIHHGVKMAIAGTDDKAKRVHLWAILPRAVAEAFRKQEEEKRRSMEHTLQNRKIIKWAKGHENYHSFRSN